MQDSSNEQQGQFQSQNGIKPGQDEERKLFIGGLTLETTEQDLTDYFSQYGQIQNVTLKMNQQTGKSKGFAFIVFGTTETIEKVLNAGEHVINNKQVDAKKAKAKPGKIFVGGITPDLSDDDIKNYFSQFGNITQVEMPFDKTKNQRKGFCFITFDNDFVVKELLKSPKQTIKDKQVDVKKAASQPNNQMGRGGSWGRGGRGGRGGQSWNQGWNQGYGDGGYDYGNGWGYDNSSSYGSGSGGSGYDYFGGGYGGGYGANANTSSTYGGGFGGNTRGRGRGRGGGQRHQPY